MANSSSTGMPIVLVPGLNCSARLYAEQIPALWQFGPVMVADHTRDDSIPAIARRILAAAPPRFALGGLSMGGYISFEIMRQAPERVLKLALLDTSARPEAPAQSERRAKAIAKVKSGGFAEATDDSYFFFQPLLCKALAGVFIPGAGKANIRIGQKDIGGDANDINAIDRWIAGEARHDDEHGEQVQDNGDALP